MTRLLRYAFFLLVVHPIVFIVIGLNVRRRNLLPSRGPAIVIANHNSHLDAMVLMTLFGLGRLQYVRPVAAADYFMQGRFMRWFSTNIMGIIPLERNVKGTRTDALKGIVDAIDRSEILILFPEGTRGEPEALQEFRTGIAHIAKRRPDVPVVPIFMHGLGKTLPRGEGLLVPFFCDVFVGESFHWTGARESFMEEMNSRIKALAAEGKFPEWS